MALESSPATSPFDVALVEEKQAEPLFLAEKNGNGTNATRDTKPPVNVEQLALGSRFTKLTRECAIVLMHEEEDVGNKAYMIEAIRVGVVDVVKFPLVTQSMRTLWQHAVRKMIRVNAQVNSSRTRREERRSRQSLDGAGTQDSGKRKSGTLQSDNSGDSTASEEGRVKRHTHSPESVLEDMNATKGSSRGTTGTATTTVGAKRANSGGKAPSAGATALSAGKTTVSSKGAGNKSGVSTASAANADKKPKQQPRSTQQWRAAEQRGRRLAIKPHTAGGPGAGGLPAGLQRHPNGMHYYPPGMIPGCPGGVAPGPNGQPSVQSPNGTPMLGQTQQMSINGQHVQVWVPMGHPPMGAQHQVQPAPRGSAAGARPDASGTDEKTQQQQQQQQQFHYQQGVYHPPPGMVLVQQANGQQVWVPAQQVQGMQMHHHPGWQGQQGNQQQGQQQQFSGDGASGDGNGGYGMSSGLGEDTVGDGSDGIDPAAAHMRGGAGQVNPHLGLGLKRSDSLQHMVESSGLLDGMGGGNTPMGKHFNAGGTQPGNNPSPYDGKLEGTMDRDMFRDDPMLEEDALDAILNQARDGNLLSFDGMDEAMLEAASSEGGLVNR